MDRRVFVPVKLEWSEQHLTADVVAFDMTRHVAVGGVRNRFQFEVDVPDAGGAIELWRLDLERFASRNLGSFATLDEAREAARREHIEHLAVAHFALTRSKIRAIKNAWPAIGLLRLAGMDAEMASAETERALLARVSRS